MSNIEIQKQRLDKWMWHARICKTRSLCEKLILGGNVRVNSEKIIKPSRHVQAGDVLTVVISQRIIVYKVMGFSDKRGSATLAAELYSDLSPILPKKSQMPLTYPQREPGTGRPTKKERRQIDSLKTR